MSTDAGLMENACKGFWVAVKKLRLSYCILGMHICIVVDRVLRNLSLNYYIGETIFITICTQYGNLINLGTLNPCIPLVSISFSILFST